MLAELVISYEDGVVPTLPQLLTLLKARKIVSGINQAVLMKIASGKCDDGTYAVAAGIPSIPGTPGKLEWFIDLSKAGKPRELEDGRVNLRDLQTDCNVGNGQKLVRVIQPVPGIPGKTVFGTAVPPPPLPRLNFVAGKGTHTDENEPDIVLAAIEGAVMFDGTTLQVVNSRVINGDVDYGTGNVTFHGDVKITGSVRAGFSVRVTGDAFIDGDVEETEVNSGGSVTILGGANGSGSGTIRAEETISVHHASQFTLNAEKEVSIREDALHCTILSDGMVTAKSIVGGSVTAQGVTADCIGSAAEVKTIIDVARKVRLTRERYDLLKRYGILAAGKAQEIETMYELVRNGMDDHGYLKSFDEQNLASLKDNTLESIKACRAIQERIEKIDRIEESQGEATVNAGRIYPNTQIKIGLEERLVRSEERNIRLKSGRG
ncbi:MAG: DUF342 domain-containing protein [Chitinispirillaceae bacterium]|nr:DUF342 domain-containing protein [Chitinispirillaceae bacterium]